MTNKRIGRRSGAVSDQPVEPLIEFVLGHLAEDTGGDAAFAIEESGSGKRLAQLQILEVHGAAAHPDWKADLEFADEIGDFGPVWRSSSDTATKATPRGTYSFWASTSIGISALHGTHHVAQKFNTTILPRRSRTLTFLPFTSLNGELTGLESAVMPRVGNSIGARIRIRPRLMPAQCDNVPLPSIRGQNVTNGRKGAAIAETYYCQSCCRRTIVAQAVQEGRDVNTGLRYLPIVMASVIMIGLGHRAYGQG